MDFGTMQKKLARNCVHSFEQFEDDVFLISGNAMQYNAPDTIYFREELGGGYDLCLGTFKINGFEMWSRKVDQSLKEANKCSNSCKGLVDKGFNGGVGRRARGFHGDACRISKRGRQWTTRLGIFTGPALLTKCITGRAAQIQAGTREAFNGITQGVIYSGADSAHFSSMFIAG
ncbi:hypothetical protein ZIOFF_058791 [Zingiber officinale]|uniref:Bromo domain-containing protein n=1 Tax=Zingiber officinale TaxID=94328 RepID=A0A8J5KAY9_ZINOF|nr:hypothetical protein ZIOFF_058791 [Zingiber officinale]